MVSQNYLQLTLKKTIIIIFSFFISACGQQLNNESLFEVIENENIQIQKNQIIFFSTRDGNQELYVMNQDGSNQQRLTYTQGDESEAVFSPDGQYIAYSLQKGKTSEIYLMNTDDKKSVRLTNHNSFVNGSSWSPDGRYLAYHVWSINDQDWKIFVIDMESINRNYKPKLLGSGVYPSWSPDGDFIVYHMQVDKNYTFTDGFHPLYSNWEIYRMKSDGSQKQNLTNHSAIDLLPVWTPDGKQITFWSTREGHAELYQMKPDGTILERISNEAGRVKVEIISRPAWSPDGTTIAISTEDSPGNFEIVLLDRAGGFRKKLTSNIADEFDPAWSP
jgi:TolB protein